MTKLVHFDFAIKNLLRNKANYDILEGFLSELLDTTVVIEAVLESESNKSTATDKSNRVDLLVRTAKKEHVIIEVQATMEWDYLSRILYGTSKVLTEYMQSGQAYRNIRKVISVSIVFFDLGGGEDYLYHAGTQFIGMHKNDVLRLGDNERKAYGPDTTPSDLFPEYYLIKVKQFNERIKNKFDEWVYFLKNEKIQPTFSAKGIKSAAKKLDVLALSEEERRAYERYEDEAHYAASMHESHYGRGKLDGREEGKAEGRAEGKAEGKIEGKAEGKAELLLQMIHYKFDHILSKEDEMRLAAKIQSASAEQLTAWIGSVFAAATLEDLLTRLK